MALFSYKERLPVKEYDLYIPLFYNDGSQIEEEKFVRLREQLLAAFGGLTFFSQPQKGYWQFAGVTYRDEIVIYRVFAKNVRSARKFLTRLKKELRKELKQKKILIIEKAAKEA
jgi:hypothetical protein